MSLALEALAGGGELEGPEEVRRLLEVGAHGVDLVDEVLHAVDAVLPEGLRDDLVVGQRDPLLVDLAEAALVDELPDGLQRGVPVGDVGVDELQHLEDGLVDLHKDAVVQLPQAQQLQHLPRLRADLDDADDADHKEELGLGLHEEVALDLGLAAQRDELALMLRVLLVVLERAHLQRVPLLGAELALRRHSLLLLLRQGCVALELHLNSLRHRGTLGHGVLRDEVALRHCDGMLWGCRGEEAGGPKPCVKMA
mmetsp:Transcript_91292/g.284481  ORF Transcript_91292/g.284481 Transcript_91292/m.284481 type:complete len:253 (+) Transcript_91292:179-937(+)